MEWNGGASLSAPMEPWNWSAPITPLRTRSLCSVRRSCGSGGPHAHAHRGRASSPISA